jgi:cytochrome c553
MSKSVLILLSLAALIVACAAVFPKPLEQDVARGKSAYPDLTLEQLTKGRQTYINSCGSCHPLYTRGQLPLHVWDKHLYPMAKKYSRLDSVQTDQLTRYIHVMIAPSITEPPAQPEKKPGG